MSAPHDGSRADFVRALTFTDATMLVAGSMVGSPFSSDAWNNVTFAAAEVTEPQRHLPRALLAGTGTVCLPYLPANVSDLHVLPHAGDANEATAAARGVPGVALVVQSAWVPVLCLTGTYGQLPDYVVVAALLFHCLTTVGLCIPRRKGPHEARPYRAVLYPWLPVLYAFRSGGLALLLLIAQMTRGQAVAGLLIVLLGVPESFLWRAARGGTGAAVPPDATPLPSGVATPSPPVSPRVALYLSRAPRRLVFLFSRLLPP